MSDVTRNPELWRAGAASLRAHDVVVTGGFLAAIGFTLAEFDPAALLARYGGVELRYAAAPDLDPFAGAGDATITVSNAELLHADLYAADLMPDVRTTGVDDAELRARWATDRDVSRLGILVTAPDGRRHFDLYDPANNRLRCAESR